MSSTIRVLRTRAAATVASIVLVAALAPAAGAAWVEFQDETATRFAGISDTDEKDYAWGDVDKDGDVDLVVVRKEPFTSPGKRVNFLLMNENGVLVDRTTQFATASDAPGDLGFNTATNDRDVQLVDVDLDGWLDIVTATTISDGDPKHIGHPRIYMNRRCNGACTGTNWLGFRYEMNRIPTMLSWSMLSGFNPRFCSVAVGDVDGDNYPDLWFGDYDSSGAGGSGQPAGADFNDRLLLNQGPSNPGHFYDATLGAASAFSGMISIPGSSPAPFPVSAFGAAGAIRDMDGDGTLDIVKQTSLNSPLYVGVAYNQPVGEGQFDTFEVLYQNSPYFISVGDLNNDSKLDVVITDDGADRYLLNQGNGGDGLPNFSASTFSFQHNGGTANTSSDDGFGSNSLIADLDNDGWNDVLIADVDVDIGGCTRRMHIYRNVGGAVGGQVELREETEGSNCQTSFGNPASCLVASIPSNKLEGVHDVAVFDLNGDGWKDLIVGRCSGTQVYINQPPLGVNFTYPDGLPTLVPPGQTKDVTVQLVPVGGASIAALRLFVSVAGGVFVQSSAVPLGDDLYRATLPAAACAQEYRFYFEAELSGGQIFKNPPGAPAQFYSATAAVGTSVLLFDDFESDVSAWSVVSDGSLTGGEWEQAVPEGTLSGGGQPAAPGQDAEPDPGKLRAFVTENGLPGGAADASDVDGGPTWLVSPVVNLAGTDGIVTFQRWFFSSTDDTLKIEVTNDLSNWQTVQTVPGIGNNAWRPGSFRVGQYVTPSTTVQVRFGTKDVPNNSLTEAAIDVVRIEGFVCSNCANHSDCNDNLFCTGVETCNAGACASGAAPCPGQQCDEGGDVCVECLVDPHCSDNVFCNGVETCNGDTCVVGTDPCPGQMCEEVSDSCVDCLAAGDCSDGLFCNGAESCVGGSCLAGAQPCPGQFCDEQSNVCLGALPIQPRMGQPLRDLTAFQLQRFNNGRVDFDKAFNVNQGLGPIFNQDSCGSCHNTPLGGAGTIEVTRFGHVDGTTGAFDPLEALGGSLLQAEATDDACEEVIPPEANVTAQRVTTPTMGAGLIEAIPDAAIQALADNPPAGVSGRVNVVAIPERGPGATGVGRFGWKSQAATVMTFSAGASRNEMGITNRVHPQENAPNGDQGLLAICDGVPDPEDGPDQTGQHFIDRVNTFQRFLAGPPQTPKSGMTGEPLFNSIGCGSCHVSNFTTKNAPPLELALRNKDVKAYSDFLLHDMGGNADQIGDGNAGMREIRTAPLWGIRVRDTLWHDGRVASGTFDERIRAAIAQHDDPFSEARASALAFAALPLVDQDALIAFLDSLGRAEFDFVGNGIIDNADWAEFLACYTGPGGPFFTPDDPCAIGDVDQDGDIDEADEVLFLAASSGVAAGELPDGGPVPGVPLLVGLQSDGQVVLTWGSSCATLDTDFAVYAGAIGDFTSHEPVMCSTAGQESSWRYSRPTLGIVGEPTAIFSAADDSYFLVVPQNGAREGSYGLDSDSLERPRSTASCYPQELGACD